MRFFSDNAAAVCPQVLEALVEARDVASGLELAPAQLVRVAEGRTIGRPLVRL